MKVDTEVWHVTPAGGNIFAELGFEPAEAAKLKIKAQLMRELGEWIAESNLKQEDAAKLLKVTRPRVSDVMRGKIGKFTIDALVDMLELAGRHVRVSLDAPTQ
jgi:predicted XRE-type DNA-binding protein